LIIIILGDIGFLWNHFYEGYLGMDLAMLICRERLKQAGLQNDY